MARAVVNYKLPPRGAFLSSGGHILLVTADGGVFALDGIPRDTKLVTKNCGAEYINGGAPHFRSAVNGNTTLYEGYVATSERVAAGTELVLTTRPCTTYSSNVQIPQNCVSQLLSQARKCSRRPGSIRDEVYVYVAFGFSGYGPAALQDEIDWQIREGELS